MSASSLIHSAGDERIYNAATGMRPVRGMVLHKDRFYRFAPSTTTYKVAGNGTGTHVYFYGTDEHDQSCAVRVSGFRPYLYVSLADLADDAVGAAAVQILVARLQASLLMMSAYNGAEWSAERQAFSDSLIGRVRQYPDRDNPEMRVTLVNQPTGACMPIVDWEITLGRMIKGHGANSGYRGMQATRFLKLYFYSPSLVSQCRALLHGQFAVHGARRQALLLAQQRTDRKEAGQTATTAAPKKTQSAFERKLEASRASMTTTTTALLTRAYDETGDYGAPRAPGGDDDSDSDDEAVQGPAPARSWDAVLDQLDDKLADIAISNISEASLADIDAKATRDDNDAGAFAERALAVDGNLQALRIESKASEAEVTKAQMEQLVRYRLRLRAREMLAEATPDDSALGYWNVCEADIDFVLRVMIDCGFAPEDYVEIDMQKTLYHKPNGQAVEQPIMAEQMRDDKWRETRAQVEIRCDYRHLARCANEALQNRAPKHLTVSLDCEMKTAPDGGFANPLTEEMIQCVFIVRDEHAVAMGRARGPPPKGKFYFRSVSFVLGTVDCRAAPREFCTERHILSFADEKTLYCAMARFIALLDPHIVTGYNSNSFDMPYMKRRAAVVGVEGEWARAWSRSTSRHKTLSIEQREFQSTAAGKIVFSDVCAEGVLFVDVLHQLRKDPLVKLRSYALNAVASLYLKTTKEDVSYALINTYNETAIGREKLRSYCEKDALLPLEIVQKQQIFIALIEMARINNCPIEVIINRGQQVRCKCALYKEGAQESPPQRFYTRTQADRDADQNDTYIGAQVVDPVPGLYEDPTVTLDWNSLYPSEQVTHNMGAGTLVQPDYPLIDDPHVMRCANPAAELTMEERLRRAEAATYVVAEMITAEPYTEGPVPQANGAPPLRYLRHTVCVDVAVKVQQKYLAHRARTKELMEAAEKAGDSETEAVLNQRQLAIKMLANSLYGMFGATCSFLYAPSVAAAITARGRAGLHLMRWLAISEFRQYGTEVIYGDTDSIFVLLRKVKTIEEAAKIGVEMAKFITAYMRKTYTTDAPEYNILKLAFEKVFRRLLLLAKKRYAGLKYEYSNLTGELTAKPAVGVPVLSGLESKRRDVTRLVGESVGDVIALLLDFRYSSRENLVRAREFIWQTMVRPLFDNSVSMYQLAITKQLRDLPDRYRERNPGRALPIHVHFAERLIQRAGGVDAANAPRSGERLSYVVVRGAGAVSQRAEDPVYVLDHGLALDSQYYLDKHVKKTLLRIFAPICGSLPRQRTLLDDEKLVTRVVLGENKAQRQRLTENTASEFLFGHTSQYIDPVPASERHLHPRILPMAKESSVKKRALVRYRTTGDASQPAATTTSRPMGSAAASRCARCKRVTAGLATGDLCTACRQTMSVDTAERAHRSMIGMMTDIEDLRAERNELVDKCQTCMGCAGAPQQITCTAAECETFWVRKTNLSSIGELERRMATQLQLGVDTKRYVRVRQCDESEPMDGYD